MNSSINVQEDPPLITIGVVVLNREWIIGKTLDSILHQRYPHDKMFVIVVDGKSTDRTVEITRNVLEHSDFRGFEVIVKRCNIPEGRNVCIERMHGNLLLFWDSDVIAEPDAIRKLVDTMNSEDAHIVAAGVRSIFLRSVHEIDDKIVEASKGWEPKNRVYEAPFVGMGLTLIRKEVLELVKFDRDLVTAEDRDFCVKARQKGFKVLVNEGVKAFDVNILRKDFSDIYMATPLRETLRSLRKTAKARVLGCSFTISVGQMVKFFITNKRFTYYLGYLPALISLSLGIVLWNTLLILLYPIYLIPYAIYQFKRRGLKGGLNALLRSILIGLPLSLFIVCYYYKYSFKKNSCAFGKDC